MQGPIPNANLRLTDIPSANADWPTINEFALTFDGYGAWGLASKSALGGRPCLKKSIANPSLTERGSHGQWGSDRGFFWRWSS